MQGLCDKIISSRDSASNTVSALTKSTCTEVNMAKTSLPETYSIDNLQFEPFPKVHNFCDLTHSIFSRLTVLGYAGQSRWYCGCICGNITQVAATHLKTGNVRSCGCLASDYSVHWNATHGATKTPEYRSYTHAKGRCTNPNDKAFSRYGGRGIEFRFTSFEQFLKEVGPRPTTVHSIERIDNAGHYEAGNVRWATPKEQARNTRRNRVITFQGQTKSAVEWAELYGLKPRLLNERVRRGDCEKCLFRPPDRYSNRCKHKIN